MLVLQLTFKGLHRAMHVLYKEDIMESPVTGQCYGDLDMGSVESALFQDASPNREFHTSVASSEEPRRVEAALQARPPASRL